MPDPDPWYRPFQSALRSCIFLTGHAIVLLYFLLLIYFLERVFGVLQSHELKLFDLSPLRYLFDLADLAVLLAYVVYRNDRRHSGVQIAGRRR